jgi:hypothetical protein
MGWWTQKHTQTHAWTRCHTKNKALQWDKMLQNGKRNIKYSRRNGIDARNGISAAALEYYFEGLKIII